MSTTTQKDFVFNKKHHLDIEEYTKENGDRPISPEVERAIKRRRKRRSKLQMQYDKLMRRGHPNILDTLIKDFTKVGILKPYHFALLAASDKKTIYDWIEFVKSEVLVNLSAKEKNYFVLKIMLAFKGIMDVQQRSSLIDILLENKTPGSAFLLNYYFPSLIPKHHQGIVNHLVCEFEHKMEIMENILYDFETQTMDFLREYFKINAWKPTEGQTHGKDE